MTAIHGFVKANRRPGELGVHSVDHFHFVVPDLVVAHNFYTEFGLDIHGAGDRLGFGRCAAASRDRVAHP